MTCYLRIFVRSLAPRFPSNNQSFSDSLHVFVDYYVIYSPCSNNKGNRVHMKIKAIDTLQSAPRDSRISYKGPSLTIE